jgi:hypothetical protein
MPSPTMEEGKPSYMEEVETVEQDDDAFREAAIVEEERKLWLVASARLHWKILLICLCYLLYIIILHLLII